MISGLLIQLKVKRLCETISTYFFDINPLVIKIDNGRINVVDKKATGNITKNDLNQL